MSGWGKHKITLAHVYIRIETELKVNLVLFT